MPDFVIFFVNQIPNKNKLKSCGCKPPLCKGRGTALAVEGLFYAQIYIFTNTMKILFDFIIRYSNYIKPILLKKFCAFNILFNATNFIMLRTVKFNYQFCFGTVKINNIFTYDFLPIKSYRICPQKIIPYPSSFRHLRIVGKASGVWSASLWKSTILPFFTLLVTLLQILSGVAFSFQSRLSTLDIKVKSFLQIV